MVCKWCGVGKRVTRRLCASCFEASKKGVNVPEERTKQAEALLVARRVAYAEYVKNCQKTNRRIKTRTQWALDRAFPQRHNHPYAPKSVNGTPHKSESFFGAVNAQPAVPYDWRSFK